MLQFINDMPVHVVGIHAVGKVTREDIDTVLIPHLNNMVEQHGEINYLLVLETDIKNFTAGALWQDIKIGLKHFTKWNKIAVVTDQKGVEQFSNWFRILIPGKSRGFPLERLDEAIKWIARR
ncbi:STAS/SEC14 domain-containing protein [Mucilaginibacter gynuensis]|uniref:STAS/SEC14 domain-containing protein n=1 Tax=Mucilaginibacter gynuensis TaxID=1302236 RepID=A0ABP8FXI9_9SPHI